MDVHKASINVAVLAPGEVQPVEWKLDNRANAVTRLAKKLKKDYGEDLRCCYEAGPTGFALMRTLTSLGVPCEVIAPALIPKQPGNRVKTDRRDAQKLAALFQAGLLTEVHPPTAEQEAVRDLCRARDDARDERLRAQHRLVKFLLRPPRAHARRLDEHGRLPQVAQDADIRARCGAGNLRPLREDPRRCARAAAQPR
jgi:transposase